MIKSTRYFHWALYLPIIVSLVDLISEEVEEDTDARFFAPTHVSISFSTSPFLAGSLGVSIWMTDEEATLGLVPVSPWDCVPAYYRQNNPFCQPLAQPRLRGMTSLPSVCLPGGSDRAVMGNEMGLRGINWNPAMQGPCKPFRIVTQTCWLTIYIQYLI